MPARAYAAQRWADFDADGFSDLAIGEPNADLDAVPNAGAVSVLYGSEVGIREARAQRWTQTSISIAGPPTENDWFGHALVAGDFDGDGFDDLAIGAPGDQLTYQHEGKTVTAAFAGSVTVLYGSNLGLTPSRAQWLHQAIPGVPGRPNDFDNYGWALAAGNFDGARGDELAIGVPQDTFADASSVHELAGSVHVIPGSSDGLTLDGDRLWTQASAGIPGRPEQGDSFGTALAVGDLSHSGHDDLVIGIPDESFSGVRRAGQVIIIPGSESGLKGAASMRRSLADTDVARPKRDDRFGSSLAVGSFDDQGKDDLAVGIPWRDVRGRSNAGAVVVFAGRWWGPRVEGVKLLSQAAPDVAGSAEDKDKFGDALTVGDFNDDGVHDLAVGTPHEDVGLIAGAGEVQIFFGHAAGLSGRRDIRLRQGARGVDGASERADHFGLAVAAGDFDGDGAHDLAIGVPLETFEDGSVTRYQAGAVAVIPGSRDGPDGSRDSVWSLASPGVPGDPTDYANFGESLGG
jgi:hypothetical protein